MASSASSALARVGSLSWCPRAMLICPGPTAPSIEGQFETIGLERLCRVFSDDENATAEMAYTYRDVVLWITGYLLRTEVSRDCWQRWPFSSFPNHPVQLMFVRLVWLDHGVSVVLGFLSVCSLQFMKTIPVMFLRLVLFHTHRRTTLNVLTTKQPRRQQGLSLYTLKALMLVNPSALIDV